MMGQGWPQSQSEKDDKKLSLAFCKKFLQERGRDFTDEQVAQIRETLYMLAEVDYLIATKNRIGLPDERGDPP